MTNRSIAACALLAVSTLRAQSPATTPSNTALQRALTGSWAGTLEYRDYSEPPTSTKRVKLPTWLTIESAGPDLRFRYIYDDGPTKTVTDTSLIHIDFDNAKYTESSGDGKHPDTSAIEGLAQLHDGRGTLMLTGPGTENDAPVKVRTTLRVGRNIIEITRETAESDKPFTFRHAYSFVRASPPATVPAH